MHTIRYAAIFAAITLAFVLSASLDQIRDDPGVFTQRGLECAQSIQAEVDPSAGVPLVWRGANDCQAMSWSAFRLVFKNSAAFEALFGVRIAADSSPPLYRS